MIGTPATLSANAQVRRHRIARRSPAAWPLAAVRS